MTLASVLLPERDCASCQNQVEWGCNGPPMIPIVFPDEEGPLERCPRRPLLDDPAWFSEVFAIWAWRENGILPDPGAWRDQAAKVPILLAIIDCAVADAKGEMDKQAKRKAEAQRRASKQHRGASGGVRR